MSDWLTVSQAAQELGMSRQTVRNWIKRRKLHAVQAVANGAFRIHQVELDLFKQRIGLEPRGDDASPSITRDLTDPDTFYDARIEPVLDEVGERDPQLILRRMRGDAELAMRYYKFPSDYAHYINRIAEQLAGSRGRPS